MHKVLLVVRRGELSNPVFLISELARLHADGRSTLDHVMIRLHQWSIGGCVDSHCSVSEGETVHRGLEQLEILLFTATMDKIKTLSN